MISNVYCVVKAALYQYSIIFIPSKFFIPSDDYFLFFFVSFQESNTSLIILIVLLKILTPSDVGVTPILVFNPHQNFS